MNDKDLSLKLRVIINETSEYCGEWKGKAQEICGLSIRSNGSVDICLRVPDDNKDPGSDGWSSSELSKEIPNYPKYVSMNNSALKYDGYDGSYTHHNGSWSVGSIIRGSKLYTTPMNSDDDDLDSFYGVELIEISYKKWYFMTWGREPDEEEPEEEKEEDCCNIPF